MTNEQIRELLKTLFVVVLGVVPLLAAFGPLAQYKDTIMLIGGIVAVVAAALGFNVQSPAQQVRNVKASRLEAQRMARFIK